MDYEEFKEHFINDVTLMLQESDYDIETDIGLVKKMNCKYEAITVSEKGSNVGVNININLFYDEYVSGTSYEDTIVKAYEVAIEGIEHQPNLNFEELTDYRSIKDRLMLQMVSYDDNLEMLQNVPYIRVEDMAVVCRVFFEFDHIGRGNVLLTNEMLKLMGVYSEDVFDDAFDLALRTKPAQIMGISEMMHELKCSDSICDFESEPMYVATVPDRTYGASVLAYDGFFEQAAERIGGDFYIIPSSVHEVILIPDDRAVPLDELQELVKMVNATEVSSEEKLTDSVYHYDSKIRLFEIADEYEKRMKSDK